SILASSLSLHIPFFPSCPYSTLSHFFFIDPPPTALYTLSLHDALPICRCYDCCTSDSILDTSFRYTSLELELFVPNYYIWTKRLDRKSTRLNSSHVSISYAVFCLKKKNNYRRHRAH